MHSGTHKHVFVDECAHGRPIIQGLYYLRVWQHTLLRVLLLLFGGQWEGVTSVQKQFVRKCPERCHVFMCRRSVGVASNLLILILIRRGGYNFQELHQRLLLHLTLFYFL